MSNHMGFHLLRLFTWNFAFGEYNLLAHLELLCSRKTLFAPSLRHLLWYPAAVLKFFKQHFHQNRLLNWAETLLDILGKHGNSDWQMVSFWYPRWPPWQTSVYISWKFSNDIPGTPSCWIKLKLGSSHCVPLHEYSELLYGFNQVSDFGPFGPQAVSWVKVFRINPEFLILRLTFHRKSASKCWIRQIIIASLISL